MVHMDITPYVEGLRRDLTAAAAAGSDEVRDAAERLLLTLEPAARLALMEAVSQAASEITAELPAGGVDVRLNGRELDFLVHVEAPTVPSPATAPASPAPPEDEDDEGTLARVTLRLPEGVKARAEEKAAEAGQSLNTWLVGIVRAATREGAINVDIDLSSIPFFGKDPFGRPGGSRRMSGWV
jgi:hypothetical protein